MEVKNNYKKNFRYWFPLFYGISKGLQGSFIGSLVFSFLYVLFSGIFDRTRYLPGVPALIGGTVIGFIASSILGALGGAILALWVYKDAVIQKVGVSRAVILKGFVVGAISWYFLLRLIYEFRAAVNLSANLWVLFAFLGFLSAIGSSGWVAHRLHQDSIRHLF